jgi:hypothetical protein
LLIIVFPPAITGRRCRHRRCPSFSLLLPLLSSMPFPSPLPLHHSPGLISSILAGKKKFVEHFLYVKETVELVPEHPHQTHRVNHLALHPN